MLLSNPTQNNTLKFIVFTLIAILFLTQDYKKRVPAIHTALSIATYPLKYIVDFPFRMGHSTSEFFTSHRSLSQQNAELKGLVSIYSARDQKYRSIAAQNNRLRTLLKITDTIQDRFTVANILTIETSRFQQSVTINKGRDSALFEGQVALAGNSIYGQTISISPKNSIIVQLSDPHHTIPVRNSRTGNFALAVGAGATNTVLITGIDDMSQVQVDDLYLSSGLGQVFPADFPVAVVKEKHYDPTESETKITATTVTNFNHTRELLLIWKAAGLQQMTADNTAPDTPASANEF